MKKIIYLLSTLLLFGMITSCEKETSTEDTSLITNYVTFELNGSTTETVPLGGAYDEPGYVAMEGESDVTSDVSISGEVDPSKIGVYRLVYSALNQDGFSASTTRTVIVYNPDAPDTDISGTYSADVDRGGVAYTGHTVSLTKVAPGFYHISDWIAGFYAEGYGYGASYAGPGYFTLGEDNTINFIEGIIGPNTWGLPVTSIDNGSYDPTTGTISYDVAWLSYTFIVTLNK